VIDINKECEIFNPGGGRQVYLIDISDIVG